MEYPGFVGGTYRSQAVTADAERTINFYVERMESVGATSRFALYPTPGVTELASAPAGPGRAHFFQGLREFAVIGTTFYEIGQFGTLTSRGTVAIGANPATISSNGPGGSQLFITSGDNGYVFNLSTNTLSQISALDGKATMGGHLDGYFLALDSDTSTMYFSALLDGTSWDPTDFVQRSGAADGWSTMIVISRYIWLMGSETSEVWFNNGTSPIPFARHPSGLISYGIAAPFSAAVMDATLIWLGASDLGNGYVLRTGGFSPEVISTFPLQKELNGYPTITDAIADTYTDLGHTFYILNLPTADATWVWDSQSQIWCERGTWNSDTYEFQSMRPFWHAFAWGQHRMLDRSTGSLYRMSSEISTDVDGLPIRRVRRAPTLAFENKRVAYAGLELDLEPGLGTATGQGSDPQVMMRMSNDGGKTWGNEILCSAGKAGEYGVRVRWNRLGQARRRTFEISVTDPIPWKITNAYLNLAELPAGAKIS